MLMVFSTFAVGASAFLAMTPLCRRQIISQLSVVIFFSMELYQCVHA